MNCDHCDNPAVVHEVVVKDGVKKEVHLCEVHAKKTGYVIPDAQEMTQMVKHFVISQPVSATSPTPSRRKKLQCDVCGCTFSRFKKEGVLGCPACYEAFEKPLSTLIERAQNGGGHHVGKVPSRAGGSIDRQARIGRLLRELEEAVSAEHYERAAQLRDKLKLAEAGDDVEDTSSISTKDDRNN